MVSLRGTLANLELEYEIDLVKQQGGPMPELSSSTFATVVCDPARPSQLVLPSPPVDIPTLDEFTPVTVEYVLKSLNSHKAQGSALIASDQHVHCMQWSVRAEGAGPGQSTRFPCPLQ